MNRFKSTKTLSEDHPPRNPKNQNKKSHPHNLFHNFTQFIKKKKKKKKLNRFLLSSFYTFLKC